MNHSSSWYRVNYRKSVPSRLRKHFCKRCGYVLVRSRASSLMRGLQKCFPSRLTSD